MAEIDVFNWSITDKSRGVTYDYGKRYREARDANAEVIHKVENFASFYCLYNIISKLWLFIIIILMTLSIMYIRPIWLVLISLASAILFGSLFYVFVIENFFTKRAVRFAKYIADSVPHDTDTDFCNADERISHLYCGTELISAYSNKQVSPKLSEGQRFALSEANIMIMNRAMSISDKELAKLYKSKEQDVIK